MELFPPDQYSLFFPFLSDSDGFLWQAQNWLSLHRSETSQPRAILYFVNGRYAFRCRDNHEHFTESYASEGNPLLLKITPGKSEIWHFSITEGGMANVFIVTDQPLNEVDGKELLAQLREQLGVRFGFVYVRNDPWFFGSSSDAAPYIFAADRFKPISVEEYLNSKTMLCRTTSGVRSGLTRDKPSQSRARQVGRELQPQHERAPWGMIMPINATTRARWAGSMTPDPYQASGGPGSPQTWNRYTYTGGDPVNRVDPAGLEFYDAPGTPCGDMTVYSTAHQAGPDTATDRRFLRRPVQRGQRLSGQPKPILFKRASREQPGARATTKTLENARTAAFRPLAQTNTYYSCIHQSGQDWRQFREDLKELEKALKKDPACEAFLTSMGTSLATVFADLDDPSEIFSLANSILTSQNTYLYGTTNDGVVGATPITLWAGLFANKSAFTADETILHATRAPLRCPPGRQCRTRLESCANDTLISQNRYKTLGINKP